MDPIFLLHEKSNENVLEAKHIFIILSSDLQMYPFILILRNFVFCNQRCYSSLDVASLYCVYGCMFWPGRYNSSIWRVKRQRGTRGK